jgi:hypothetical protein
MLTQSRLSNSCCLPEIRTLVNRRAKPFGSSKDFWLANAEPAPRSQEQPQSTPPPRTVKQFLLVDQKSFRGSIQSIVSRENHVQYETHIFSKNEPWATEWHILYLTAADAEKVFLSTNESVKGYRRNGGEWARASHDSYRYLRREVDEWVRANAGPQEGEVWECDRYYHADEPLPALPQRAGRRAWLDAFKCWPEVYGNYHHHQWAAGSHLDTEKKGIRAFIRFRSETTAVLFRTLFL